MLFCSAFSSAMSDRNRDLMFMEEMLNGLSLIRLHDEGYDMQIISRQGSIHRVHLVVIASFSPAFRTRLVPQFVIYEWLEFALTKNDQTIAGKGGLFCCQH
jgi:hypothetical protein